MAPKDKEPTKAESLIFTPANMFKAIYITGIACGLFFGLRSEIRENKATQTGVDNVQNLRIENVENGLNVLEGRVNMFVSREADKPKPIKVESE
jgi:hypothetical protein